MLKLLKKTLIYKSVVSNPVIFLLIFTVVLNYGYWLIPLEWFPEGKFQHYNPPLKPHSYWWFGYFIIDYLVDFSFVIAIIISTKGITKDIAISYFLFDLLGMLSYIYQGWPEPTENMVIGFCLSCLVFISLGIWRFLK